MSLKVPEISLPGKEKRKKKADSKPNCHNYKMHSPLKHTTDIQRTDGLETTRNSITIADKYTGDRYEAMYTN